MELELESKPVSAIDFDQRLGQVAESMVSQGASLGVADPESLAATLVLVIIDSTNGVATVARVGDSTARWRRGGEFIDVFDEGPTQIEDSGTAALPRNSAAEVLQFELAANDMVLLATDGLYRPIDNSPSIVGDYFETLFTTVPSDLEFSRGLGFVRRGAHDDRSAIGIWRNLEPQP